jgi:hypothetical protein
MFASVYAKPGYTGTVHLSSSDPKADLNPDYTFTAADGGVAQLGAGLFTSGSQSLTATDRNNAGITGSQTGIVVNPGAAVALAVTGFPSPVTAGTAHNLTVTAQDQYGNTATDYAGTVHFSSDDSQAQLPGNSTLTNGTGTFPATLKTAATSTIAATDTVDGSVAGQQDGIVVNPAAAVKLQVADFPSPVVAGTDGAVTVTALDPYNNVATGYAGTVHLSSSDPKADLNPDYTFTAADGGVASLGAVLYTAGTQSITVTDLADGSVTGSQSGIVVNPAALSALLVAGFPSPITVGTPGPFTVTAQDVYGNTVTDYTGTVTFGSTDPAANLPSDYTFMANDQGTQTFTATLNTVGTWSLIATDTADATITGEQDNIEVDAPTVGSSLRPVAAGLATAVLGTTPPASSTGAGAAEQGAGVTLAAPAAAMQADGAATASPAGAGVSTQALDHLFVESTGGVLIDAGLADAVLGGLA